MPYILSGLWAMLDALLFFCALRLLFLYWRLFQRIANLQAKIEAIALRTGVPAEVIYREV